MAPKKLPAQKTNLHAFFGASPDKKRVPSTGFGGKARVGGSKDEPVELLSSSSDDDDDDKGEGPSNRPAPVPSLPPRKKARMLAPASSSSDVEELSQPPAAAAAADGLHRLPSAGAPGVSTSTSSTTALDNNNGKGRAYEQRPAVVPSTSSAVDYPRSLNRPPRATASAGSLAAKLNALSAAALPPAPSAGSFAEAGPSRLPAGVASLAAADEATYVPSSSSLPTPIHPSHSIADSLDPAAAVDAAADDTVHRLPRLPSCRLPSPDWPSDVDDGPFDVDDLLPPELDPSADLGEMNDDEQGSQLDPDEDDDELDDVLWDGDDGAEGMARHAGGLGEDDEDADDGEIECLDEAGVGPSSKVRSAVLSLHLTQHRPRTSGSLLVRSES